MRVIWTVAAAFLMASTLAFAADDGSQKHCPNNPKATHRFFTGSDTDRDKRLLETLAESVAKSPTPVCILAFIDAGDAAYSKKLAIRRAVWVRDMLNGKGVPSSSIAVELRLSDPDQDKASIRQVHVILGP